MQVTRIEVLKLYKQLISYSKSLTLTDPAYFRRRVGTEFRNNKSLTNSKDITFAYQVDVVHFCLSKSYQFNNNSSCWPFSRAKAILPYCRFLAHIQKLLI
ncbi:unnamed protein product [Chrysodeixis includens]|uniref:Complex 1 LYR protein domain-containing protein n=1 Tax=Chrysodeixis includens TaxID=689277 RepID=A0A9N8KQY1_CHRIL|nr:unnamed protein product [Chrysodeixis includens]